MLFDFQARVCLGSSDWRGKNENPGVDLWRDGYR